MKKLKSILVFLLGSAILMAGAACTPVEDDSGTTKAEESKAAVSKGDSSQGASVKGAANGQFRVGVAMPTQSSERWINDGSNMKKQLEDLGYTVDLQYAEDDVQVQVNQLENMISSGANCLVVASIDSSALVNVLAKAKAADIPVIAYDRLLMDTDAVSYYATFDNYQVGVLQANYLVETLGLKEGKGPYNIELFSGSPDDNNAKLFWQGAMDTLKEYLDSGKLVVRSGQTDFDKCAILRWSMEVAQQRMENILSGNYSQDQRVDAVLSPFDGISYGIAAALEGAGYSAGAGWPVITGQDAEIMAIKNIISGKQAMTIFKDTRILAEKCVTMVQAVLEGTEPEINDTKTYNNNVKVVPSYLCVPETVTKDNYEKILVDSGYYSKEKLQ